MRRSPLARAKAAAQFGGVIGPPFSTPPSTLAPPSAWRRRLGRSSPLLIVLLGLGLSVEVFRYIRREEQAGRDREFRRRAQNIALRTEDYLHRREDSLFALRDFFENSESVTRSEFENVARDFISRQAGIRSLQWAPLVPAAARAAYEQAAQADGFAGFQFTEHPEGTIDLQRSRDRPVHAPVFYLVPYVGNEPALGYDLASATPGWQRYMESAATGALAASGRIRLLTSRPEPTWGYLTSIPVYRTPAAILDPTTRTARLKGFVLGVFELSDVLEEMFRRMGGLGVDALFLDSSAPAERQFLHYHPAVPDPRDTAPPTCATFASGTHTQLPVEHAGRHWEIWMRPSQDWMATQRSYRSWFFSGCLTGLSLVLGLYLRGVRRRTSLVEQIVTERTNEVIESRRELSGFLHALPGMAFRGRYDDKFDLLYVSDGSVALTGYSPEDFLAGRIHLRDLIHPEDLGRVRDATRAAIVEGRELELDYRLRTQSGGEKWVLARGRGRRAEREGFNFFEGLAIDITAQKLAERERLGMERKLLEGQKLESLGLLAGGVAHDFNNLLTGVLGNANLARLMLPTDSVVHPHLQAIETASLRAAELCRQMLAYAGKGRFVVEPVDLSALAEGLMPLLKISVGHHVDLKLKLAAQLPAVMADATQLRQIVMNLVLNAADATSGRSGTITLSSGLVLADVALLARCAAGADCVPGDYVFLEVRDNGVGMTPEIRAKIFDPFFTTKFAGRGLGLAAALGIVRSHHGALQVESTPGQGSSFRLLLPPEAKLDARPAPPCAPAPADWHRAGHALVIDDEESVREVAAHMLASFGLQPRTAEDGAAGLALFRENPAQFDVVLLDLVMPVMNGEQTLAALRAIRPDVRVLLISGYTEGELLRRFGPVRGQLAFLSKPFTREGLANHLRDLLG